MSQRQYRIGKESMTLQYPYACRACDQVGRNGQLRAQDLVDAATPVPKGGSTAAGPGGSDAGAINATRPV